jgi:transposase-like protein
MSFTFYGASSSGSRARGQVRTFTAISKSDLERIEVPLPPLNEQRRILAMLEESLGKVNACQKRLAKISTILKRFRQSVLAAACSGRLTADWRQRNPAVESAPDLLNRIKEQRLIGAQTAKDNRQILEAFRQHGSSYADVENGFDDIPERWVSCLVGQVGTVCNGSTPSRKCAEYWGGLIPWVSSGEVRNNLIRSTRETISEVGYENCSVRLLPKGSVLLAMIGEGKTRGQSAILEIEVTINQNIAAVTLEHGLVSSEFLWRWFQLQYESTRERGGGSGPQALNCERVRELPFVLPPREEQQEIVRRVEALFKFADEIEARYQKAQAQVDKLAQSILAKAFRANSSRPKPNSPAAKAATTNRHQRFLKEFEKNKERRPLTRQHRERGVRSQKEGDEEKRSGDRTRLPTSVNTRRSLQSRQRLIDRLKIKRLGIEVPADPSQHLLVFRMPPVSNRFQKVFVAWHRANVLRRTSASALNAHRITDAGFLVHTFFDHDLVLPPVAEIIEILECNGIARRDLTESN